MNHSNEEERISHLFCVMMSLFEKFVQKADKDIMQPFLNGDFETANENLKTIGSRMSIDKLLLLIFKNFEGIIALRISINKHYGKITSARDEKLSVEKASKNLHLKLSNLTKDMSLLAGITSSRKQG